MFPKSKLFSIQNNVVFVRRVCNVLKSKLDTTSTTFIENNTRMTKMVENLKEKTRVVVASGGEKNAAIKKHLARGKLMARDRVNLLLDKSSAFLELSGLCGLDMYDGTIYSGGIVTGIGKIHGRLCMVIASDATIKGGTYYEVTNKKHVRAQEIALNNGLPCIFLSDSGGANIISNKDIFPNKDHILKMFFNVPYMSGQGIMQLAAVMGSCTAGGAVPAVLSDENVIVNKLGTAQLAGPPLVKAATGENVTSEELGGAKVACGAGAMDHYAIDEQHAIDILRQIIKNHYEPPAYLFNEPYKPPLYDTEELYGIPNEDIMRNFEMREVIARIFDGSELLEYKKMYNDTIICGWAKLYGKTVGVIANNGVLISESSLKAANFIELCVQRQTPIIFLVYITGFLVGLQSEHSGIAKHATKFLTATACAQVPKLTLVVGGSFGAGSAAMCHRSFDPRFLYMWPNGQLSIMGGHQASHVLAEVASAGKSWNADEKKAYQKKIFDQYNEEGSPYYNAARVDIDGVIDPKDSRKVLGLSLAVALNTKISTETKFGVFRM